MCDQTKGTKAVPFRVEPEGISNKLIHKLLAKGKKYGLIKIIPFSTDKIIVAEWVRLKCRYGCSRFNTSWCCPPVTPDVEFTKKLLEEYTLALLLVGRTSRADFYRENRRKRVRQIRGWKGTVIIERLLFMEGFYKAFSLVGEGCALCEECAYPQNCRFPRDKRPSIESFSIDVLGTLKKVNIISKLATNINDSYNYYSMILLE